MQINGESFELGGHAGGAGLDGLALCGRLWLFLAEAAASAGADEQIVSWAVLRSQMHTLDLLHNLESTETVDSMTMEAEVPKTAAGRGAILATVCITLGNEQLARCYRYDGRLEMRDGLVSSSAGLRRVGASGWIAGAPERVAERVEAWTATAEREATQSGVELVLVNRWPTYEAGDEVLVQDTVASGGHGEL